MRAVSVCCGIVEHYVSKVSRLKFWCSDSFKIVGILVRDSFVFLVRSRAKISRNKVSSDTHDTVVGFRLHFPHPSAKCVFRTAMDYFLHFFAYLARKTPCSWHPTAPCVGRHPGHPDRGRRSFARTQTELPRACSTLPQTRCCSRTIVTNSGHRRSLNIR